MYNYFNFRLLIQYVNDDTEPAWKGYLYAFVMFIVAVIRSILLHQYFHRCYGVGMRIRGGLIAAIYRKVLLSFINNFSSSLSLSCRHYV